MKVRPRQTTRKLKHGRRRFGIGYNGGTARFGRSAATRLGFEPLETRAMLSADPGWAFALGGPAFSDDTVINVGPDGYVYAAGVFSGTVDFDPGPGVVQLSGQASANDAFVAKYTPQGAVVWAKKFGGDRNDYVDDVEFDAAGNLYLTGHSLSSAPQFGSITLTNQGNYDVFVTKVDATSGSFLWARNLGGTLQDTAYDVSVSAAGDVYAVGTFRGTADFDPSPTGTYNLTEAGGAGAGDAFVWKLDTNGNFQWARQFGNENLDNGHRLDLSSDGYLYVAGTFRGVVDYGQPGNPLELTSSDLDTADLFMVKLDEATGDAVWARQASGPDHINAARVVADGAGSLYFAGGFIGTVNFGDGTPTLTSAGGTDSFLTKWDTAGNLIWAESVAGSGEQLVRSLELNPSGNLLLTYVFDGTTDFDPGGGTANLTSAGQSDGAALQINADGSFGWVRQMSGLGETEAHGIIEDSAGNVYVAGFFQNSVLLPTGHNLTRPGNGTFLMKLAFGDAPTKFYVVDDASANLTHEYNALGTTAGNYSLNSGNAAPRGAASTAVGDRIWVVDANRTVYIYDINGNQLGSWSAGTMASNATPEGIATNGTDVWIVDSKSDKVFKYAGAASRTSGSQNAASSFNLNGSNADSKDIAADGSSLWVVNDSTTDKVFKYTIAGGLLGSWTIGSANSKPTGITIDPANVSDIWIVDNGTDRVYEYIGAAGRTSGSQAAATSFALAAGNTNPQGIADPPPRGTMQQVPVSTFGLSLARAATVSNAVVSDIVFLVHSADKAPVRKIAHVLARQQVFDTTTPRANYLATNRGAGHNNTASEPDTLELHACADDEQAAVDLAFESDFASVI